MKFCDNWSRGFGEMFEIVSLCKNGGKTLKCTHTTEPYCTQYGQNSIEFWPF